MRTTREVPCRITVCRDCCCGGRKIRTVDHEQQVEVLKSAAAVRVSDCLDVCESANVVVVHPSAAARAKGARPVWFGLVNDDGAAHDIVDWVRAGGPGVAELPAVLELYEIPAPGRS